MIEPEHIRAAIIGFHRQGARVKKIMTILNLDLFTVAKIIATYFKNEKLW